jgi:Protein of unknown function (DUF1592)/Protein of unknown function (DUF1588)/Protein of unknown function (DUF1595)/Protein of unknown function (DUF1587)/Protein of unknown function (DUF1585)
MKRSLTHHKGAATSHTRAAWMAATAALGGLLAVGGGCTGKIGQEFSGAAAGPGGPGSAGAQGGGGQGNLGPGTAGQGGDPYAVPSSPPATTLVATPRVVRLSRQQWSNTVRDLLKLTDISDVDSEVSGDALVGFDNEADALFVTEQLRKQLADAAEKLADKVTADATALARLVPANAPTDAAGKARAFITSFGQRAFRRPLTDAEVTTHVGLFNQGPTLYPGVDAFKAGASLVIQAMLQSANFLYRTELGTATAGTTTVPLDNWEVASKLALSITNTMPDDALFAAAAAGQLRDKAAVAAQANRLLDGQLGTAGLNNFNLQVYRLGTYDGITRDPILFPDFKPNTPAAMKQEVLQFLGWLFAQGRGIREIYTTPVGFVNSLLSPLYGVPGAFSSDPAMLTRVDLDSSRRSGLLTQAGFLSSYMEGSGDPDIIHRGVFIATRLLCKVLPAPDPRAMGTMIMESPTRTNRESTELLTGKGTCGEVCHGSLFNPLGYAFENYDAIGKYRDLDRGKPVDAADVYRLDGQLRSFANGVELSHLLADAKETHACYVQNMMSYLHGRPLAAAEQAMVDYYARLSRAGMVSVRALELAIVTDDAFLNRLGATP